MRADASGGGSLLMRLGVLLLFAPVLLWLLPAQSKGESVIRKK